MPLTLVVATVTATLLVLLLTAATACALTLARRHARLAGRTVRLDHELRETRNELQQARLLHQQALRDLDVARKALLSSHVRMAGSPVAHAPAQALLGESDFGIAGFAPTLRLPPAALQ